jgi:hypothetical protein
LALTERPAVPETLEEVLSPAWLTAALGRRFPGIKVTRATLGPVVARVSTNARCRIECEGGVPPELSPYLCIKGYFTDGAGRYRQVGAAEAMFYRDLADLTGVRTLRSVYADVDPDTGTGVVITEDVAASGATFLDALSPYTPEQAAVSLEQYAILHARTWNDPKLEAANWLSPRLAASLQARGLKEIRGNFDGPIGAGVPDAVRDPERLIDALKALPAITDSSPHCLVHGDAHVGNLFLDAEGRPCLVDWQLVQRGPWYIDVGYHLGCVLPVEDRRKHERELLECYLRRASDLGAPVPAWDEAWAALSYGLVYGFFLWGITLKVDPAITTEMLTRLGAAVADHDALRCARPEAFER